MGIMRPVALVAQLDRVLPSEGRGRGFESRRVRHLLKPRNASGVFSFQGTGSVKANCGTTVALLVCLGLHGCATLPLPQQRSQQADALASTVNLMREQVRTDAFLLTSYVRIERPDLPLTVYIEGDGLAFRSRSQPSDDPTPLNPVGLALAAADPAANVLYLARPCQFAHAADNPRCAVAYWTGKRFAEEVVQAMDQAVDHYARQVPGQPLHLVGYSGGGAIAALLAARRVDIASLRTVAGNLDVAEFNRLHRTTPMPESLNPIDQAARLRALPQIHFHGTADRVVPGVIAERFAQAVAGDCTHVRAVPGIGHGGDWAARWPGLLAEPARCGREH